MNVERVRDYLLSKPGAEEGTPFGPDVLVYKVGGKMFGLISIDRVPPQMNLKCDPDRALRLRDRWEAVIPGYHMNKKHWNTVVLDDSIPDAEISDWIDHSWELVIAGLPRTARDEVKRLADDGSGRV